MTKSYQELQSESQKFLSFLKEQKIDACVDEQSFRDYHVKICNVWTETVILYHKSSKGTFSLGLHEIKDLSLKSQVEELWHRYQYPNEQSGLCAYVDGSFYNGQIGWGAVIIEDGQVLAEECGVVSLSPEEGSRQIAGEVYGVLGALSYAEEKGYSQITIFHDYVGLQKWASKEWKAKSAIAQYYVGKLMQNRIAIKWEKVQAHTGNRYNELADKLAKSKIM